MSKWMANAATCLTCGTTNDADISRADIVTRLVYARCKGCRVHGDGCSRSYNGRCRCPRPTTAQRLTDAAVRAYWSRPSTGGHQGQVDERYE